MTRYLLIVSVLFWVGCGEKPKTDTPNPAETEVPSNRLTESQERLEISPRDLPDPDLDAMDPAVGRQLADARLAVIEQLDQGLQGDALGRKIGELGKLYHAYDRLPSAEKAYKLATAHDPDAKEWSYYSGMVAQRQGRYGEAVELFRSSLGLTGDQATAVAWRLGRALRQAGQYDESETWLKRAAEDRDRCPAALFELGQLSLTQDRLDDAVSAFEQVLVIQPDAEQVFFPLGQALRRAGRNTEATTYLARSAEREKSVGGRAFCLDPLDARLAELTTGAAALVTRGQHARFAGDLDAALKEFERAVELAPDDPVAHQALAKGLVEKGDLDGALQHFRRAVELNPDSPTLSNDLAIVLLRTQRIGEAKAVLEKNLTRHPDLLASWLTMAQAQHASGELDDALRSLDKALALDQGNAQARGLRAKTLMVLGRRTEAAQEMARLMDEHPPEDPAERFRIAGALAQLGSLDQAYRHLIAVADDSKAPDRLKALAHLNIAGIELGNGNHEEARRHLQSALALDPDLKAAEQALARLEPSNP